MKVNEIICGDSLSVLKTLPAESVDCVITSPPYWGLRDYGTASWEGGDEKCDHLGDIMATHKKGSNRKNENKPREIFKEICGKCGGKRIDFQVGLEKTPEEYVAKMVDVFREVRRVLKKEGVMFLNLGDSYAGSGKGRNADGTPGRTESLNKNNRGSMSGVILPSNAKRDDAYDISDKAQEDYQKSDCLCENLCDECLAALRRSPHTFRERVSKLPPLLSESIREHKESPSDHLPTSGFSARLVRTEVAIQETATSVRREVVLDDVLTESTRRVSFQQHPVETRPSNSSSAFRDEANEKNPDGVESSDKRVCICGTVLTAHPLCRCKSGIFSSHKAYPYFTNTPLKSKDLVGIPWRVAFALQADGWYLRQDIIWAKPNPMPESVQGSHFYRHRVTIEKYEELQRVWKTKSSNQDGASNLSDLSLGKVSDSEITLHEKSERDSNSKSERTTTRSKREKESILKISTGVIEQKEVYGDSERDGERPEESGELQGTTSEGGGNRNGTGLDGHSGAPSLSLFLLQPEKFQNDSRPQNPIEQRREKLAREHSASLPQVQLHKERQNRVDSEEIDCPGCYMCENQNGFIFTLSAGRCTKSHEYVFLLSKSPKYFFDSDAIKEKAVWDLDGNGTIKRAERQKEGLKSNPDEWKNGIRHKNLQEKGQTPHTMHKLRVVYPNGKHADGQQSPKTISGFRNKRSVWTVTTKGFAEAHFATFPEDLVAPMVLAGSPKGGIVLDCFSGSGTTALVSKKLGRQYLGIELNETYVKMARERIRQINLLL